MFVNFIDWVYPERCLLCRNPGLTVCTACVAHLPRLPETRCLRCAVPLPEGAVVDCCGRCQRRAPAFAETCAAFAYAFPVDMAIGRWKYGQQLRWIEGLAQHWLAEELIGERPQALMPVPLHWRRMWTRGFNQAGLLADCWGRHLDIPVLHRQAKRVRHTAQQAGRSPKARRSNLAGAFAVKPLTLDHVAIVDDVMTTGSTTGALASALLQAGVKRVDVWVLARAVSG